MKLYEKIMSYYNKLRSFDPDRREFIKKIMVGGVAAGGGLSILIRSLEYRNQTKTFHSSTCKEHRIYDLSYYPSFFDRGIIYIDVVVGVRSSDEEKFAAEEIADSLSKFFETNIKVRYEPRKNADLVIVGRGSRYTKESNPLIDSYLSGPLIIQAI